MSAITATVPNDPKAALNPTDNYHLLYPMADQFGVFNVVRYITFRTAAATLRIVKNSQRMNGLRLLRPNGSALTGVE